MSEHPHTLQHGSATGKWTVLLHPGTFMSLEMKIYNGMQGRGQDFGVPSLSVRTSLRDFSEEGEFYLMQVYAL